MCPFLLNISLKYNKNKIKKYCEYKMAFSTYLTESIESDENAEIDLDDFIKKIKSKGLYGYNVFKHITEDELKKIIADDNYFIKKEKGKSKPLAEMVLPPKKEDEEKADDAEDTKLQQNKLSLAVRLGLKKEAQQNQTTDNDKPHIFGKPDNTADNKQQEKPKPLSFADRMRAENERRQAERAEQQKRDQAIRDQKLKQAEEEAHKVDVTFNNKSLSNQNTDDSKLVDKTNDNLDKQLTNAMFKKKIAKVSSDENGYKKVDNASEVDDKEANNNLKKEMDDKFPEEDKNKKLGNSDQPVKKLTNTEYSKRTLLAIADRMDFDVYCKFKKANGQIRTGNFRIGKSDAQVTQKQNTIIVRDLDLDDWRTIPLDRIIQIKPI